MYEWRATCRGQRYRCSTTADPAAEVACEREPDAPDTASRLRVQGGTTGGVRSVRLFIGDGPRALEYVATTDETGVRVHGAGDCGEASFRWTGGLVRAADGQFLRSDLALIPLASSVTLELCDLELSLSRAERRQLERFLDHAESMREEVRAGSSDSSDEGD